MYEMIKKYCFDCKFLTLKRKDGVATGEKICSLWGNVGHADFQPACEKFASKVRRKWRI